MAKKYTIIPTEAGPFVGLDLATRAIFGLIWDRWQLSKKTNEETGTGYSQRVEMTLNEIRAGKPWRTSAIDGEMKVNVYAIYCVFRQSELVAATGLCERTIRRCIRDLEAAKVLKVERAGIKGANRYFIQNHIEVYFNKT